MDFNQIKKQLNKEISLNANLDFIKKSGSTSDRSYIFRNGQLTADISNKLGTWLKTNINDAIDNFGTSSDSELQIANLAEVDNWEIFKEKYTNSEEMSEAQFSSLGSSLAGYTISMKLENYTIGYFRKKPKSKLLTKKGNFTLFFKKGTFSEMLENKGVNLDEYYDFVFIYDATESNALVKNRKQYKYLFDVYEQECKTITSLIDDSPLSSIISGISIDEFKEKILKDGNFRNRALTQGAQQGFKDVTFNLFERCKNELQDKLELELDIKNHKIIIDDSRKAINAVLRVIGYRDRKTLDNIHLIEGPADNIVH